MAVGKRILAYLGEIGVTQKHLSKKANIDLKKLNLCLNGHRRMSLEEYEAICFALGVGIDKFLSPRPIPNKEAV